MSRYLIDKFGDTYRVLCPIDKSTNDYPRDLNGSYATDDLYIKCANKVQIFHYGGNVLQAYVPSIGRGRNILRAVDQSIVFDIEKTDAEVLFKFKAADMDKLVPYLKPSTLGAGISPYSAKNRPKTAYNIPDEDLVAYTDLIAKIPNQNSLAIGHITQLFFKNKYKSKKSYETFKQDLKTSGMRNKEYIHSRGLWNDYIKYLRKEFNA